jgi:hypothetical protein
MRHKHLASILALTAFLAVCAPAEATPAQFGSPGEGAGEMTGPRGIAVDQGSGEVFVVDSGNSRAEAWTESGVFRLGWGEGVADGAKAFETCESLCEAGRPEAVGGGFGENPSGIAVDNSLGAANGDVYVEDPNNNRIEQFSSDGAFLASFGGEVNETKDQEAGATQAEKNVCTAASGDICKAGVAGRGHGEFEELSPRGSIAVGSEGTIYVADRERVQELSATGHFEGEMTLPSETGRVEAMAVDASKDIYVTFSLPLAGLTGVHKYSFCPGVCTPAESGATRDEGGEFEMHLAMGPANELLVYEGFEGRILAYTSEGQQTLSLAEEAAAVSPGVAIAFNPNSNTMFMLHTGFVRTRSLPSGGPVVEDENAAEVGTGSATVTALVNREGPEPATYRVEYGLTAAYGSQTEVANVEGEPFEAHRVSAAIQGLKPETTYHFRFVVTNVASETAVGEDATFTTLPAVGIDAESVEQVTATSARLLASLNPHGSATSYRFEYGTSPVYGNVLPVPGGVTGATNGDGVVSVLVEHLAPLTTYHYRLVAKNALGADVGADHVFTTSSSESRSLLDGRVWEQVSPPDKHGVALESITSEGGLIQAAADGSAITYIAHGPITETPAGNRSVAVSQELSTRERSGWATEDINAPNEEVVGLRVGTPAEYQLFSEDLGTGIVWPQGKEPLSPSASERTIYRREANGEFLPLVYPGNVPAGTHFGPEEPAPGTLIGAVEFVGASKDASHIVLSSPAALVTGLAASEDSNLFEWSEGRLELVSVLPNGRGTAEEHVASGLGRGDSVRGAVSEDGDRVFFSAGGHLYVHDRTLHETLQIDVQQPGARGGNAASVFEMATPTGSKVFFADSAKLTRGSAANQSQSDLYMCEVGVSNGKLSCLLKDLTPVGEFGESADVLRAMPGASEDGDYVYFVARGALALGSTPAGCPGEQNTTPEAPADSERCNLYVANTVTDEIRLVAQLSARDAGDWGGRSSGDSLASVTSRVSGNGEWLAFMSGRTLTGFDNADAEDGMRDQEVFLYQRSTGDLTCATCAATGERPSGILHSGGLPGLLADRSLNWSNQTLAGVLPGWTRSQLDRVFYQSRYLSNEGRLFFDSAVSLVPADSNGTMDVYEFEPDHVGGCLLELGCIGLISSGESGEESAFVDASSSGDDVFFLTTSQLAKSDDDSALDLYDAHVCSASAPCPGGETTSPAPCDSSDSCRESTPPVIAPEALATEAASGPGNFPVEPQSTKPAPVKPKAKKCPKGEKLSHGKCKRKPSKRSNKRSKRRSSKKASARVERRTK